MYRDSSELGNVGDIALVWHCIEAGRISCVRYLEYSLDRVTGADVLIYERGIHYIEHKILHRWVR